MSEAGEILGAVVARVPLLVARIGSSALRLLFGSRRAARSFRRTLRRSGMSRRRAGQLAKHYGRQVDVKRIVSRVLREMPWQENRRRRKSDLSIRL